MSVYPFRSETQSVHKRQAAQSTDEQEEHDAGYAYPAKDRSYPTPAAFKVERKEHSCKPHHYYTKEKGYSNAQEYTHAYLHSLISIY